jgi:hypothetical protein
MRLWKNIAELMQISESSLRHKCPNLDHHQDSSKGHHTPCGELINVNAIDNTPPPSQKQ